MKVYKRLTNPSDINEMYKYLIRNPIEFKAVANPRVVALFSNTAFVYKLAKMYGYTDEFTASDEAELKELVRWILSDRKSREIKSYLKLLRATESKYQKRLLVCLKESSFEFNQLLLNYLIDYYRLCNYTLLPSGKYDRNRSLLQKKATTYCSDPIAFYKGLKAEWNQNEQINKFLKGQYSITTYQQFLDSQYLDESQLTGISLKACESIEMFTSYLLAANRIHEERQKQIIANANLEAINFREYNRNLVLAVQEDDPSNKVTLLKLVLVVTCVCIFLLPLEAATERYADSLIVIGLFAAIGKVILTIAEKLHSFIKSKTEIDNWFKLFISYILYGLGFSFWALAANYLRW